MSKVEDRDFVGSVTWGTQRCYQLRKLKRMVHLIGEANRSSSFVEKFREAEQIAQELSDSQLPDLSFLEFLNEVAIESRAKYREQMGDLPE